MQCDSLQQENPPSITALRDYVEKEYASGVYQDYSNASDLKFATFKERFLCLEPFISRRKGSKLLDVGCATGYFMAVAQDAGWNVTGIDYSVNAAEKGLAQVRNRILVADVNNLPVDLGNFDLITAYDIIEHTLDPSQFLNALSSRLNPGGIIAIATPDASHILRYVMRGRWPHIQPNQHTVIFSRNGLVKLASNTGFECLFVGDARKTLSFDYLAGQISIHNPFLSSVYRFTRRFLPSSYCTRPRSMKIGETLYIGRKM